MSYGLSTRTVASPQGVKQRFSKGVKFVPLSQFFLDRDKGGEDEEESLYGKEEPKKKGSPSKVKLRRRQASEERLVEAGSFYSPQKCMYCDNGASKALVYADGRAYLPCCRSHVNKGQMRIWRMLKDRIVGRRRIPLKSRAKTEGQAVARDEGMTGTANVGTTAVPVGPGIRHVSDILDFGPGHPFHELSKKRRKKKRQAMSKNIGRLLRRVM